MAKKRHNIEKLRDSVKEDIIKRYLADLEKTHNINNQEIIDFLSKRLPKDSIPASIFNAKLSSLETIVKYLKENINLSYKNIADSLNRNERNIWATYQKASKKLTKKFIVTDFKILIPTSIFTDKKFSVLESIVVYLKEEFSLNYHEIARLLKRDDRTIWTTYQRAKKKYVWKRR